MPKAKILIVDDEPFNVDYLEQELEEENCETMAAYNGREALEAVRSNAPDLVLLDIMMPIMDGFEVLSRLKADPDTRDIPVIVISANNQLQSIVKGIQLGAEDYLPKPFEPVLLHARITSGLEKKRLRDLQRLYMKGLERELEIAREIQQGFLPSGLPEVAGWGIAAYFKAAREVAGDFYDAFMLPNGNLVCVVGDVCGKGVGAALFMTLFRSLIRATCTTDAFCNLRDMRTLTAVERLQHVVTFTNNYIAVTHERAKFVAVVIGIFDPETGSLAYVNCGNEAPLLVKQDGAVVPLPSTGPVVGVFPDIKFSVKETIIDKNEFLLVYTDGIPDALNEQGLAFGSDRLYGLLREQASTPGLLLDKIEQELQGFIGAAEQFDDITVLAIKRDAV